MKITIIHNPVRSRFEAEIKGEAAVLEYEFVNGAMALIHTFVPPKHRHQGIAFALIKFALEYARAKDLKVIPGCSSVVLYIEQHPEYEALLLDIDE
ncbi:MAG: GNAT family N-acetyltransferase [Bacteroidota bacterium]|nr:GNAT family N-acetyltransferase [Bacteroidota bacterium]MDP4229547.1 GNAT family N-acetyltransferase [Bacteroidota bacterium]MDP4235116.1 GNAT family N-acetyltransferase [Bacteroidota bacterium]